MCQCQRQPCSCSKCGCSCGSQKTTTCGCSCSQCQSQGEVCGEHGHSHAKKFLELADQAWMEVLKEKIKEHIKANSKHIDELARLVAEANQERWKKKIEAKSCCCCFEDKLKNFFEQSCNVKK